MSRYSRYMDALIAQQRLLEWSSSRMGMRFLRGFVEDMNAKHSPEARRDPRVLAAIQIETLREAEPVYVSPDAADLIDHARKSWTPEKVIGSDAFVPHGFALFPRPIMLDDMPPTPSSPLRAVPLPGQPFGLIPVRAMAWLSIFSEDASMGTFWITYYTDVDDEFDIAEEYGIPTRWELPEAPERTPSREELRRMFGLTMVHMWQWSWSTEHDFGDWDNPDRYDVLPEDGVDAMMERARQQTSLIQTFWRIASQFVPAQERVPRGIYRDARRHGLDRREVTIITLRRERERPDYDPEATDRHYHVSFLVRGYWAIRHTRNGPRQTWVRPHIKGDGPFQDTTRGWEFTR